MLSGNHCLELPFWNELNWFSAWRERLSLVTRSYFLNWLTKYYKFWSKIIISFSGLKILSVAHAWFHQSWEFSDQIECCWVLTSPLLSFRLPASSVWHRTRLLTKLLLSTYSVFCFCKASQFLFHFLKNLSCSHELTFSKSHRYPFSRLCHFDFQFDRFVNDVVLFLWE